MRRKRIANNILNEMPELKEGQVIMRSLGPKGKNLHEAELPDGTVTLVTLPPKFRNLVWIKRGVYFNLFFFFFFYIYIHYIIYFFIYH